jgi:phosphoribosyl 1,2-cyclic phosphodiesterase
MRIRFWGVRGSTPTPELRNARYGGNTCCIEVRLDNDTLILLDCGSGMRGLGKSLLGECGDRPIQAYIYLTHFHWDHIQGIPFFHPLYKKGNAFFFHSVLRRASDLKDTIEGQMANPYFPVDMNVMAGTRHFYDLDAAPINVNGAILSSAPMNHPQGCVGYRIEADGGVFVLATDTEPGSAVHDRYVRELARGADLLVYDTQYTPEQLVGEKKGWGHSSWLEGVRIAQECGVKRLALFHHDPDSDDAYVDGLVIKAREEFADVVGASEGLEVELPGGAMAHANLPQGIGQRTERRYHVELPMRVRWHEATGETKVAEGITKDVSRSGIYFIAPEEVQAHQSLELELVVPDEITHRGDLSVRFLAKPVRQEQVESPASAPAPSVGVGAQFELPERRSEAQETLPPEEHRR